MVDNEAPNAISLDFIFIAYSTRYELSTCCIFGWARNRNKSKGLMWAVNAIRHGSQHFNKILSIFLYNNRT